MLLTILNALPVQLCSSRRHLIIYLGSIVAAVSPYLRSSATIRSISAVEPLGRLIQPPHHETRLLYSINPPKIKSAIAFRQINCHDNRRGRVPHDILTTSFAAKPICPTKPPSRHIKSYNHLKQEYTVQHAFLILYSFNFVFSCIFQKSTYSIVYLISFYIFFSYIHFFTYLDDICLYICILHLNQTKRKQTKKTKSAFSCRNMSRNHRRLVPGPSPSDDRDQETYHDHDTENGSPPADEVKGSGTWKKRVSTACLACKKSKRKVRFIILTTLHLLYTSTPTSISTYQN